jgi:hypothetical protein
MAVLSAKKKAKKEKRQLNGLSPKAEKNSPPTVEPMPNGHVESTPVSVKKKKKKLVNGQDNLEEANKENNLAVSESFNDGASVTKKAKTEQADIVEDSSSLSVDKDDQKQRRKAEKLRRQQEKRDKKLKRKEARAALHQNGGKPLGAAAESLAAKVSIVRTARKRMLVS